MRQQAIGPLRLYRAETTIASRCPFISVIVPVRNEAAFIADTLQQLLEQHYESASLRGDRRRRRLDRRHAHHRRRAANALRQSSPARQSAAMVERRPQRRRRRGARRDRAGHRRPLRVEKSDYLQNLADAFAESGADCVGRPQPLDVTGATSVQRAIAAARASRLGHHPASHIYSDREGFVPPESVAVAYRRGVFDTVGLFDERFDACEDVEFNHRVARAGLTCWFTPRVQVHYHPRTSLSGLFRQMMRYGRGRVRLLRKHPDTFSLPGFVPAAFLAGVVAGPLLAWWSSSLALLYVGVLGVYGAALLLFSLAIGIRERDIRMLPLLPLVFLMVHTGAGAGVWCELLLGPRRAPESVVLETKSYSRAA